MCTAPAPSPHRSCTAPLQVGTITDLLCQLSLFVACMVLDERRRHARRCALCPLLQLRPTAATPLPDSTAPLPIAATPPHSPPDATALPPPTATALPLRSHRCALAQPRAAAAAAAAAARRALTHGVCTRATLLIAYAALTVGSALAASHVAVGVQLYELVPRDSSKPTQNPNSTSIPNS